MISYLTGKVIKSLPHGVILDIGGIGYEVHLPLTVLAALAQSQEIVALWVYTRVREDAISLYGFQHWHDRQAFEVLIQVNGVGPKVALAILSTLSVNRLKTAVAAGDTELLCAIPGIGKRTAEKILVDLKGKLDRLPQVSGREDGGSHGKKGGQAGLLWGREPQEEELNPWQDYLCHDLYSALANLGFKDKDIAPVLQQLEVEAAGEDFATLIKKALTLVSGLHGKAKKQSEARHEKESETNLQKLF